MPRRPGPPRAHLAFWRPIFPAAQIGCNNEFGTLLRRVKGDFLLLFGISLAARGVARFWYNVGGVWRYIHEMRVDHCSCLDPCDDRACPESVLGSADENPADNRPENRCHAEVPGLFHILLGRTRR